MSETRPTTEEGEGNDYNPLRAFKLCFHVRVCVWEEGVAPELLNKSEGELKNHMQKRLSGHTLIYET